ncbi:hypothetical protein D9615_005401 [Tricholomella constricta]|uniref:Uncharacterized protein n=1 Tax=Tricholomella constricta TaxID=117010 RepID=A0A8H5M5N6_9AGAR|nr:hypothetical protein D9615_005401 [Tricholomella constricta]
MAVADGIPKYTCCPAEPFRLAAPTTNDMKLVYEGGGGLPIHYARAFGSLQHLHSIFITIPDFGGGKTTLRNDQEHNKDLWAGECDRCMEIMYEDGDFRDRYVARKQGLPTTDKDFGGSVYVAPPALKRVEWTFWNAEGCEEVDVQESWDEWSDSDEDP